MTRREHVVIVGAGLTGSLLAILLGRRGHTVTVIEKRRDIRHAAPDNKRTIAMSISRRGWRALEVVGLDQRLRDWTTASYGRITHRRDGACFRQFYGNDDEAIHTIDRKTLNACLIDQAMSYAQCRFLFDSPLERIDFDQRSVLVNAAGAVESLDYDYLIAADGVFSACRAELDDRLGTTSTLAKLEIGYKELSIPFEIAQQLDWDPAFVHVWPAEQANFVALPAKAKDAFLCNLFCSHEWVELFTSGASREAVTAFLAPHFPALEPVLRQLQDADFAQPSANIFTSKSRQWNYGERFLMLGDAVHAMAPFYAMGMNTCFEDCVVFDDWLSQHRGDLGAAIATFQSIRENDVCAMQRLALGNFNTLLRSSETWFDQGWRLDRRLTEICPDHWASESALVSFFDMPFSRVEARVSEQARLITDLGLDLTRLEQMSDEDLAGVRSAIAQRLQPLTETGAANSAGCPR